MVTLESASGYWRFWFCVLESTWAHEGQQTHQATRPTSWESAS